MINRIINMTKLFLKSSLAFTNIENAKLNIRGIIKWGLVFIVIVIGLLSYKILDLLLDVKQESIFLSILFLIIAFLVILQTMIISINLFFSSKEIEYILPLPVKPIELLISKFNVLLISIYATELIFAAVPLVIYGIVTQSNIFYYFYALILLVVFPIIPAMIAVLIIMFFMRIAKFFKNINRFQNIITLVSIFFILTMNFINVKDYTIQDAIITDEVALKTIIDSNVISEKIGKYFFTIKPSVLALTKSNSWNGLIELLQVVLLTIVSYAFFIIICKNIYLKCILENLNKVKVSKDMKNISANDFKKRNSSIRYINKEWKLIIRNPAFFAQFVLPVFYIPVLLILIALSLYKGISAVSANLVNWNSLFACNIDLNFICIVIGICQITNFMSISAITSFSREGKNASFIKYIPISYYKQFICKSIPTLMLDMIPSVIITVVIYFIFYNFDFNHVILVLFMAILINIIRINFLEIYDLINPMLNWDSEYILIRRNSNILISICLLAVIILLLIYFANALKYLILEKAIILIALILIILLIMINIFVKKNEKKIFKKII